MDGPVEAKIAGVVMSGLEAYVTPAGAKEGKETGEAVTRLSKGKRDSARLGRTVVLRPLDIVGVPCTSDAAKRVGRHRAIMRKNLRRPGGRMDRCERRQRKVGFLRGRLFWGDEHATSWYKGMWHQFLGKPVRTGP